MRIPIFMSCLLSALIIGLPANMALAQTCRLCAPVDEAQADNESEIPLEIDVSTGLNFSKAALSGQSGGAIDINPHHGGKSVQGGLIDLGGMSLVGTVNVKGTPGRNVRIELPQSVEMTASSGGVVRVVDIKHDMPALAQLDQNGRLTFSFGGRLVITQSVSGMFRGRIPVTVNYQ
ncbi:hypothetical protein LPB140_00055 [Sphingorhabdus lutea]|uniref:DUF4402 domain-containing protein n=2 Tax=Sphingorhabdus lutea TaxID=1913578 RepID=A0A1L3JE48_9SPHN|nr:hypothetical protein LPB140_00055 [Sphingorhabdus lutea]